VDLHQLKTFVAVAREGSITRASERIHLSQPAVSAHIKGLEDALGLPLFERTARGMSLTSAGQRLLLRAEQTLSAHRELLDEATRMKGRLTGKLRLGAGSNSDNEAIGRLLTTLSERCPEVEVALKHGTSLEVLTGIRNGSLDAGFYNEPGEAESDLVTLHVSRFGIYVVAPPGLVDRSAPLDWEELARHSWVYPTSSACCGRTAEALFKTHRVQPKRVISVDREDMTRTLVASGIGVGLLHAGTAKRAEARSEVDVVFDSQAVVRVLFAHLATRAEDPLLGTARSILRETPTP
jgi:DNA-binding transcriptional LysR family regulator